MQNIDIYTSQNNISQWLASFLADYS